ncbi:MAG: glycosyltransferase family 2 protein [Rhodobacteraceae bacterium]|nr:glycosyltransferase family 2 protein [Paracoccaceae bacterium]
MPRNLIICPTFDHAETLLFAISSVQAQTMRDWELKVILDGSPDRSIEIVEAFATRDSRISFDAHPKGDGYGERYRDAAIKASDAERIFHLGDDDLWAPEHMAHMSRGLDKGDWALTGVLFIGENRQASWHAGHLGCPPLRAKAAKGSMGHSGLNNVAVRRAAYDQLDVGWEPAKPSSEVNMWRKYLARNDVRAACSARATVFKFAAAHRDKRSSLQRAAELSSFATSIGTPEARDAFRVAASFGRGLCFQLYHSGAAQAGSFEEAMALAHLSLDRSAAEWATDGEAMALRLWPKQRAFLELIWQMLRALETGDSAALEALHRARTDDPVGTARLAEAVCVYTGRQKTDAGALLAM